MMASTRCRICLKTQPERVSLFANRNGSNLAEMIRFCSRVEISDDDEMPKFLCIPCVKDVTQACTVIKRCRKSDAALRMELANVKREDLGELENVEETDNSASESVTYTVASVKPEDAPCTEMESLQQPHQDDDPPSSCGESEQHEKTCKIFAIEFLDDETDCYQQMMETQMPTVPTEDSTSDATLLYCCFPECTDRLPSLAALQHHAQKMHWSQVDNAANRTSYECNRCGVLFPSIKNLNKHQQHAKGNSANGRGHHPVVSIAQMKPKICCGCYESFPTFTELLQHRDAVHALLKNVNDPTRPVQCEVCYRRFRGKTNLRAHQMVVYKPKHYSCVECGKEFDVRSKLATHAVMHMTERNHQCSVCGQCFKNEQNLKTHSLVHQDKREVCSVCGRRFHRKSNLRMHQRVHQNTYYYECKECSHQCKNKSQLKEHQKVHTKEKPFQCRHCQRKFSYFSDRKRHEMSHTGDYPFKCECSKTFVRKVPYDRHRNSCKERNTESPLLYVSIVGR